MGLLTDIQQSVVDNSIPLTPSLRKAKILAYRLGNAEFKLWVDHELSGYPKEGDFEENLKNLPAYRKGAAILYGDFSDGYTFLQNHRIPYANFPPTLSMYYFFEGIPTLEKTVTEKSNTLRELVSASGVATINKLLPAQPQQCINAWKPLSAHHLTSIVEIVRDRLLTFTLELQDIYPDLDDDILNKQANVSDEKITQVFHITVQQGASMTTFDQRGQTVKGDQYNASRDINFSSVQNKNKYIEELEKLQDDFSKAVRAGELEEGAATDAEYQIKKAVQEAKKPEPDKAKLKTYIEQFGGFIKDVASLAPLVVAGAQAIQVLDTIF